MGCQNLLSGNNKKNVISLSELPQGVMKVNGYECRFCRSSQMFIFLRFKCKSSYYECLRHHNTTVFVILITKNICEQTEIIIITHLQNWQSVAVNRITDIIYETKTSFS